MVVQSEFLSVQLRARVDELDRHEARNRRAPIFLERGVSIRQPEEYYYRVEIVSPIRPSPSPQTDRKAVTAFGARVASDIDTYPVLIADMSREGVRVLSTEPIPGSETMELTCEVEGKVVRLPAQKRYVRVESAKDSLFSVGFRFDHVSRIDAARWKVRLNEAYITPARAQSAMESERMDLCEANTDNDLRMIANKLLAKLREVNRAERQFLKQQLSAHNFHLPAEALRGMEAQLDVMARHKEQFADNLASTIDVMNARIQAAEAA